MKRATLLTLGATVICFTFQSTNAQKSIPEPIEPEDKIQVFKTELKELETQVRELSKLIQNEKN